MKKGTRLYSIIKKKCPECHEGDFFDKEKGRAAVKVSCDQCGLKYHKEPGFYQGSYYVAYGLGVAKFVSLWVATRVVYPDADYTTYLWVIVIGIIVLSPFTFPLSKIIWANLFMSYKPNKSKIDEGTT